MTGQPPPCICSECMEHLMVRLHGASHTCMDNAMAALGADQPEAWESIADILVETVRFLAHVQERDAH